MRIQIAYAALGLALVAGTAAAQAQTGTTSQISDQPAQAPITQEPAQTPVQSTRTVRPSHTARRTVTTRRTIVSQQVLPTQSMAAPAVDVDPPPAVADPDPFYDQVAPIAPAPVVGVAPVVAQPVIATPGYAVVPLYRYVYEPDRILVIDPTTNIAIQAIPR